MPRACRMTAVATRKLPTFVVRNPRMRPGSLNHMNRAMKYVTQSTEMMETRACVVMARLLLDISIRSRIVRPTVASVGARLPPTSQWTESRGEQQKRLQRHGRLVRVRNTICGESPSSMRFASSSSC